MNYEHYLGIGCIILVIALVLYKKAVSGESLKDIYKKLDEKEKRDENNL